MTNIVSAIWSGIERTLFPSLEIALEEPLSESHKRVVRTLEIVRVEEFVRPGSWQMRGRPLINRGHIARAFVANAVLNIPPTKGFKDALQSDPPLRTICGL